MSVTLMLLIILILVIWAGGFWYGPAPVRGNNLVHLLLAVIVVILLFELLTGHRLLR